MRSGVQLLTNERILDFTNLTQLLKQSSGHYTAYFRDAFITYFIAISLLIACLSYLKNVFFRSLKTILLKKDYAHISVNQLFFLSAHFTNTPKSNFKTYF